MPFLLQLQPAVGMNPKHPNRSGNAIDADLTPIDGEFDDGPRRQCPPAIFVIFHLVTITVSFKHPVALIPLALFARGERPAIFLLDFILVELVAVLLDGIQADFSHHRQLGVLQPAFDHAENPRMSRKGRLGLGDPVVGRAGPGE